MSQEQDTKLGGMIDSGERTKFETGAIREIEQKIGRYDLISPIGLRRLARWYQLGAEKYADRNWEKGLPTSGCINSAFRHLIKYLMGMNDEDHLAAIAWNVFAVMHFEEVMPEMQDIPNRLQQKEKAQ